MTIYLADDNKKIQELARHVIYLAYKNNKPICKPAIDKIIYFVFKDYFADHGIQEPWKTMITDKFILSISGPVLDQELETEGVYTSTFPITYKKYMAYYADYAVFDNYIIKYLDIDTFLISKVLATENIYQDNIQTYKWKIKSGEHVKIYYTVNDIASPIDKNLMKENLEN